MNTKNGDKVPSEMSPYLQQNQQMQTKIDNIQTIAFDTECRLLIENYQPILRQFDWRFLKNEEIQMYTSQDPAKIFIIYYY